MSEAESFECEQCYETFDEEEEESHSHPFFGTICGGCNQENLDELESDQDGDG